MTLKRSARTWPIASLPVDAPAARLGPAGHEKRRVVGEEARDAVDVAGVEGGVDLQHHLHRRAGGGGSRHGRLLPRSNRRHYAGAPADRQGQAGRPHRRGGEGPGPPPKRHGSIGSDQWISSSQAREREEVPVVGPDLPRTVLHGRQRDLQVEDARPLDVTVDRERRRRWVKPDPGCQSRAHRSARGTTGRRRPRPASTGVLSRRDGSSRSQNSARRARAIPHPASSLATRSNARRAARCCEAPAGGRRPAG